MNPILHEQTERESQRNLQSKLFATAHFTGGTREANTACRIEAVAKRRDGGTRYWCSTHRADATAKYGKPANSCRAADARPLLHDEILDLSLNEYPGGIALWGAVPAVYDTTRLPMDRGIHVHSRTAVGAAKSIDATFRAVRINAADLPVSGILIEETDAIYYMVSSVFDFDLQFVICSHCNWPHLDKDYFSVRPHRRHLCAGCGKHFTDSNKAIGNPIVGVRELCGIESQRQTDSKKVVRLRQADFPGGIQVWGSNPAFLWTGGSTEESGIHVHAYKDAEAAPVVDDTFFAVEIDGHPLDQVMVRVLMAQNVMPSLSGRVQARSCDGCGMAQFDHDSDAYTPTSDHKCEDCEKPIKASGHLRKVVFNPLPEILNMISKTAVRSPQQHSLNLPPETL